MTEFGPFALENIRIKTTEQGALALIARIKTVTLPFISVFVNR